MIGGVKSCELSGGGGGGASLLLFMTLQVSMSIPPGVYLSHC